MDLIYEIPGKVKIEWDPTVRAVIDHWITPSLVTLAEFRTLTLEKGLPYAIAHGGHAYIIDNSQARGAFSQEIQAFGGTDVLPAYAKGHIQYFLVVAAADSPLANLSAKKYQAKVGPNGIQLVMVPSMAEAQRWLRERAH